MPSSARAPRRSAPAAGQDGIALVLAMIFSILLYILVAELVVAGRMVRATGENDALLARMRTQMRYQLQEAESQLLGDLAGAAEEEAGAGGAGALGGALGGAAGGGNPLAGAAGGEGEGEQTDPSTTCDSTRDSWFQPVGHPDSDLTVYTWVEDENRKFNILALWSPDEEFAETAKERLVRLIDRLREDSDYDVTRSDASRLVDELIEWGKRSGTESMPRPRLKSDDEKQRDLTLPLHLDELMMLPVMEQQPELFFDKVIDGKVYLGLESVLTLWTSLGIDPGDPEKVARQRAQAAARGENVPEAPGQKAGGQAAGGQEAGGQPAGGENAASEEPPQPDSLGIRINVNTASRQVLRALFPSEKIPDRVIDAIIKYRNTVDEEAMEAAQEGGGSTTDITDFGSDMRLGEDVKYKFFETVADLENVEEFAQLPDPEIKTAFQNALTTKSEVFSIHLAALFKRNEERRVFLLRRARSIVLRVDDGADGQIVPLVPFEERTGLRVLPVDMQDEEPVDRVAQYAEMDTFAQEERAWNPFLIDFYLPEHQREQFYQRR